MPDNGTKKEQYLKDVLENFLYVTVGFSLVNILSKRLGDIKNVDTLISAIVTFAILVAPSALFIAHMKSHSHPNWLMILDYGFLFFFSAYSFELTFQFPTTLKVFDQSMSLAALSIGFMVVYDIVLQIYSLTSVVLKNALGIRKGLYLKILEGSDEVFYIFLLMALLFYVGGMLKGALLSYAASFAVKSFSAEIFEVFSDYYNRTKAKILAAFTIVLTTTLMYDSGYVDQAVGIPLTYLLILLMFVPALRFFEQIVRLGQRIHVRS